MRLHPQFLRAATLASAGMLAACDTGTFSLAITDAPVDSASEINIRFTGVELSRSDGGTETFTFSPARTINLLELQDGDSTLLLDGVRLQEGDYRSIRLLIEAGADGDDSSVVDADGSIHPLQLQDAASGDLAVDHSFEMKQRESYAATIDFDLRRSVLPPEGADPDPDDPYRLRPVLRAVDTASAGTMSGSVSAALLGDAGCAAPAVPAVYVYPGSDVEPDDAGSAAEPPLTSAIVRASSSVSGTGTYTVGFLAEGSYTAAFTCGAASDDPAVDDELSFPRVHNVTISESRTTTRNFE